MKNNKEKTLIISGVNLFQGGPLKVYFDCLDSIINSRYYNNYKIVAFVHNKDLFREYFDKIDVIEVPKSRSSFIFRLFYEYVYFYVFSLKHKVDIWLSLHDITPNVIAKKRYVYCHNPLIFEPDVQKLRLNNIGKYIYSKLYTRLYKKNIKKNKYVIVQQNWIREEFKRLFKIDNIIVARPIVKKLSIDNKLESDGIFTFLYPAFPRSFKNFELICKAVEEIDRKNKLEYQVLLTIDGTENEYSNNIVETYKHNKHIKFIGLQNLDNMKELYCKTDCLVFPSKLETWGLPISEFASTGREMLIVDLPYAHETVGTYEKVDFFESDNVLELAKKMNDSILGKNEFHHVIEYEPQQPYCNGWDELCDFLLE